MKRFKPLIAMVGVVILILASLQSWSQEPKPKHAPNTLPGVEPEMLTAEYWIAQQDNPDEVIMTPEEIEQFNAKVRNKKVVFRERYGRPDPLERSYFQKLSIGLLMNPVLPLDLPDTLPGDSLRVWLKTNIEYLYSRDFYDGRNLLYSDGMKQELVDNMNIDGIPDVIKRGYGLIVKRANVRLFPTSIPGYSDTKWEMDYFQTTGLFIIKPVAILHASVDGDFLYVESPIARGWISAENIALADREEIRTLTEDKNFLMATEHKVPVYGEPSYTNFALYLYFSAKLPLMRRENNGYVVRLPYRKTDGSLGLSIGYIKPDADVHIGYLPYTKRNVLTQIFKLLNQPYGWGDQLNNRDCSGTQRVVHKCFGIVTGRWPTFILLAPDHQYYPDQRLSVEEKLAEVAKLEPAITWLGSGGHALYLLGKAHNGKIYFMHQGGWGYDEGDQHYYINRLSINHAEHKWYHVNSARVYATFRK